MHKCHISFFLHVMNAAETETGVMGNSLHGIKDFTAWIIGLLIHIDIFNLKS